MLKLILLRMAISIIIREENVQFYLSENHLCCEWLSLTPDWSIRDPQ
jgi:hypothetical protein